eukprot:6611955-Pyramimonas_sp.AAC.1
MALKAAAADAYEAFIGARAVQSALASNGLIPRLIQGPPPLPPVPCVPPLLLSIGSNAQARLFDVRLGRLDVPRPI